MSLPALPSILQGCLRWVRSCNRGSLRVTSREPLLGLAPVTVYQLPSSCASISLNIPTPFNPSPVPTPTTAAPAAFIRLNPPASRTPPIPTIWMWPSLSFCSSISFLNVMTFPSASGCNGAPARPPIPDPGRTVSKLDAEDSFPPDSPLPWSNTTHEPSVFVAVIKLTSDTVPPTSSVVLTSALINSLNWLEYV